MNTKENKPQSGGGVLAAEQVKQSVIKNPVSDILTQDEIENLLGEKFTDIVMYDLKTNQINRNSYNERVVVGEKQISKMATEIKTLCSDSAVLCGRTPVALFAKTVDCSYSDWFTNRVFFRVPPYDKNGRCIAGNIIFLNKEAQKYETLPRGWFYAGGRTCRGSASEESMLVVADALRTDSAIKNLTMYFARQQTQNTK